MFNKIYSFAAATVATAAAYISGLHITVKVLVLFMVFDFALGMGKAIVNKELTSKKMYKGGVRKCTVFLVIIVSHYLGIIVEQEFVFDMAIYYYIAMETLSIFEHAVDLEVPMPKFLLTLATLLKEKNDDVKVEI